MNQRNARGLTLFEVMIGLSIFGLIALMIAAIGIRSVTLLHENQVSLSGQQDMTFALRHFSEDVRKAIGMASMPSDPTRFILRQPRGEDSVVFVTYRFTGMKLQRGENASPQLEPASWLDVIDPALFEVLQGEFTYHLLGGAKATDPDAVRRIDLGKLRVRSLETQQQLDIPTLSATMREASFARALQIEGGSVEATPNGKKLDFRVKNLAGSALSIRYFAFTWPKGTPDNPLKKLTLNSSNGMSVDWQRQHDAMGTLPGALTLPVAGWMDMTIHFEDHMELSNTLMLDLFKETDAQRRNPIMLVLEPRSLASGKD